MKEPERNGHSNEDSEPLVNSRTSASTSTTQQPSTTSAFEQGSFPSEFQSSLFGNSPLKHSLVETKAVFGEEQPLENNYGKVLPTSTTAAALGVHRLKSDLIITTPKPAARFRKKSEEGKKVNLPETKKSSPGKNRKQSGIPVGIAVAWQRHVTSNSGTSTSHTSTNSYAKHHHHSQQRSSVRVISSPPPKPKRSPALTAPMPMAEASEDLIGCVVKTPPKNVEESRSKALKMSSPGRNSRKNETHESSTLKSSDPEYSSYIARDGATRSRVSVSAANNNSNTGYFASSYGFSDPYSEWNSQLLVPNASSQQSYNATVAAYMQQLSMHPQLQYGYNNLSAYMYHSGYSAEQIHQYEQFLLQQSHHQEQFERHRDQRRLGIDYDHRPQTSTPVPALSPRISIPSPSPTSAHGVPFAHQNSLPWASDLYHHHHPMTLVSSATLSPRSLASSTPSPITTYESLSQHSYLLNRKCITPNPAPLKQFPFLNSPFSPSIPGRDTWKEKEVKGDTGGPMSLVTHQRTPTVSPVADDHWKNIKFELVPGRDASESMCTIKRSNLDSMIIKQEKSVDYSRLESLIEKRGEASVRLLANVQSPSARVVKMNKQRQRKEDSNELVEKIKKASVGKSKRLLYQSQSSRDCDGIEKKVPEMSVNVPLTCAHNQSESINSYNRASDAAVAVKSLHRETYFLPIIESSERAEESIYETPSALDIAQLRGEIERPSDLRNSNWINPEGDDKHELTTNFLPENFKPSVSYLTPGLSLSNENSTCHTTEATEPITSSSSSQINLCENNKDLLIHCDTDLLDANYSKLVDGSGAWSNLKVKSISPMLSSLIHTFPKIVISSEENHLNLLATVAQEIGPYIDMNPNPTAQPRFENLENIIHIQSDEETSQRRMSISNASSIATTNNKATTSITTPELETNDISDSTNYTKESTVNLNSEEAAGVRSNDVQQDNDDQRLPPQVTNLELMPFQLKIPRIIQRLVTNEKLKGSKKKSPPKISKKTEGSTPIRKQVKSSLVKVKKVDKIERPKRSSAKPKENQNSIPKQPKKSIQQNAKKSTGKKIQPKKKFGKKLEHEISSNSVLNLTSSIPLESTPGPGSGCIYDFDFEDVKSTVETFKHFTTTEKLHHNNGQPKGLELDKKVSMLSPVKKSWSTLLNSKDLNTKPVLPKTTKKSIPSKAKDINASNESSAPKRKRPASPGEKTLTTNAGSKKSKTVKNLEGNFNGIINLQSNAILKKKTSSLRSSLLEPVLSASLNTDSNTSFSNDSSNSTWKTNPILAVTAVIGPGITSSTVNVDKSSKRKPIKAPQSLESKEMTSSTQEVKKVRKKRLAPQLGESSGQALEDMSSPQLTPCIHVSSTKKKIPTSPHHIKPCLKAEYIVRIRSFLQEEIEISSSSSSSSSEEEELLDLNEYSLFRNDFPTPPPTLCNSLSENTNDEHKSERLKIRKPSIDMNIFSRRVKSTEEEKEERNKQKLEEKVKEDEWNENVVIGGVEEMIDEMRILTEIHGLFYTGKLNALEPPDVYGVTLDNERGATPHIIFSAEEVLEKCVREVKPWEPTQLPHGLRICAYWSPMYSGLYPGRVSTDYNSISDLVPVEFDDGDTGVIKICEIRLLASDHPVREHDPNPLLTLEKKQRKRRHSSATGSQSGCTGDHEEDDCGEAYCAKIAKLQEAENTEEEDYSTSNVFKYWKWRGLGYKLSKTKQNRHKEFFPGIQRGNEVINVGDAALFITDQPNRRPYFGRVEKFWEKKGIKNVTVRWFYHPEEADTGTKIPTFKYPGALFDSPHIDENEVRTIAKKCEVLPFQEYKDKYGHLITTKSGKSHKNPLLKGIYYVAGYYDPFTRNLKMNDLK